MRTYILKKCGQAVIVCFGVSIIAFVLLNVAGDPVNVLLPPEAGKEDVALLRKQLGLDKPIYVQYGIFLSKAIRGDFGNSLFVEQSAISLVMERVPATLELAATAMLLAVLIAVPLGIISAIRQYSITDNICTTLAVSGQAMPIFWFGIMLIIIFSVKLHFFPSSGRGEFRHLILPAFTLAVNLAPIIMRLTRSGMLEVLSQDYIRTARAKGLGERIVLVKHAFKNVAPPVITVIGLQVGRLFGGSIITETVFAWPGVGQFAVQSILNADYPVVQACIIMMALMVIVANLTADIIIAMLDPRIQY